MDICSILVATTSADQNKRKDALEYLDAQTANNYSFLVQSLFDVIINPSSSKEYVTMALLYLKNVIISNKPSTRVLYGSKWLSLDINFRKHLKNTILSLLGTDRTISNSCAQLITSIACVEFPQNQWPDLMATLSQSITQCNSNEVVQAAIQCMGYICQDVSQAVLTPISTEILNNIIFCMKSDQKENIRIVATRALYNSLEFISRNFAVEVQRNMIMTHVCESAVSLNIELRVAGLQCLSEIIRLYYEYMDDYMNKGLFQVVYEAMKSTDDEIALQGIEFWCTLAETEETMICDEESQSIFKNYSSKALHVIVPPLLERLCDNSYSDDDDAWTPHKAAGVCMLLLSNVCGNDISSHLLPFIGQNYLSSDACKRDASMIAMGSLIDGQSGDQLQKIIVDGFEIVVTLFKDTCPRVRDSTMWTLGKMYLKFPHFVLNKESTIKSLTAAYEALSDIPQVATNACWTFIYLVKSMYSMNASESGVRPESLLISQQYESIIMAVINTIRRPDAGSTSLRTAAFELLSVLAELHPYDCRQIVENYFALIVEESNKVFEVTNVPQTTEQAYNISQFQSLYCIAIQSFIKSMDTTSISHVSQTLISNLVGYLAASNVSTVKEDLLQTLGVLISYTPQPIVISNLANFMPFAIESLQNCEESTITASAASLISDVVFVINKNCLPFSQPLISIILAHLNNPMIDPKIKPPILTLLGDIAIALGEDFIPHLPIALETLKAVSDITVNMDDDIDVIELSDQIRTTCLETYTSLIQSLYQSASPTSQIISVWSPHIVYIMNLVERISADSIHGDDAIRCCCGLIGDLIHAFKSNVIESVSSEYVKHLIEEALSSKEDKTKSVAIWLKQLINSVN